MKRAATKLATFPDYRQLEEVAQGISHIKVNASDLNEAALRMHRANQLRASEIMRGMAEEEAAKVLVLIDAVRCPREKRGNTLKRFYDHLAKRIYAATSSKPNIRRAGTHAAKRQEVAFGRTVHQPRALKVAHRAPCLLAAPVPGRG